MSSFKLYNHAFLRSECTSCCFFGAYEPTNAAFAALCTLHQWLRLPSCAVDLLQTKEVICRAWDSSMNTQPMNFTWNLMGMMNNYAYRVKVGCV